MRASAAILVGILLACSDGKSSPIEPPPGPTRSWRMGFSAIPPRPDEQVLIANLDMWSARSDAAIMHISPPWAALLSGISATAAVNANELPLANYYRGKNLQVVVMIDATDGLNRAAEAPELVAAGRSISEPAVQQLYRQFVLAIATIVRPEYLGLAAETNLIRMIAPPAVYASLKQMVNAAAADLQLAASSSRRYVSVQVDVAWGWGQAVNTYIGVEQDFTDFPFVQALGLSSYPYFVYGDPDDVPLDYYSRLPNGRTLPVLVVEGGWTSASAGAIVSSPEKQARYLRRQARMLDSARAGAVFQLTFTDLDTQTGGFPPGVLPFAFLGLADTQLRPKPALTVWDSLFAIRRSP